MSSARFDPLTSLGKPRVSGVVAARTTRTVGWEKCDFLEKRFLARQPIHDEIKGRPDISSGALNAGYFVSIGVGVTEDLRWTAARLLGVGKFAIDSAVAETLKGSEQLYTFLKGKLNGPTLSGQSAGSKKQNYVLVEEMQAKLERMQEHLDSIHQPREIRSEEQMHLKQCSNEPPKCSTPELTSSRKIFIRSRL